jgi:hypothetical protein
VHSGKQTRNLALDTEYALAFSQVFGSLLHTIVCKLQNPYVIRTYSPVVRASDTKTILSLESVTFVLKTPSSV